ncbi:protein SUPPRESSOR OF GENE SILENCING 3-like [Lycium barbarum]|uniref:protein SUPPRESSOR OF GENE SILENCING 3-like n=1 Tax=Lycium barbarum TaxID=112863 RepID=UPI00293E0959|nr:protein SUPPRESSOR OF GENE SILENCING 3-like [Lycium barbarum]
MEYQEQFFKNQFKMIYNARIAEEDKFEQIQQEQREIFKKYFSNASSTIEDYRVRAEKVKKLIKLQVKERKAFVQEKESLIRAHEERKRKLWEEEMTLEEKFDLDLARLMEKYSPKQSEQV